MLLALDTRLSLEALIEFTSDSSEIYEKLQRMEEKNLLIDF